MGGLRVKLLIIESPNKAKKIAGFLGEEWRVMASFGHVRDLPEKGMGLGPSPGFEPEYEFSGQGESVVGRLKAVAETADAVYLGTDPDREGEAISWHLAESMGLREKYHRVTFNEITAQTVRAAIAAPRKIDGALVQAQFARRSLDRLVGYTASPALQRATGVRHISAGRVQSVAVRLVAERVRAIAAFKSVKHYGAQLAFMGGWTADWITRPHVTDESPYVLERGVAERVVAVRDLTVMRCKSGTSLQAPPAPFITSTLQRAAGVKLGFDPDYTMKLAQSLFEGGSAKEGHITYMRTDNPNISEESLPALRAQLAAIGVLATPEHRKFTAPASAQAGHPAITPTHWDVESAGDTADERALYQLIRVRALACQAEAAEYATRAAVLEGGGEKFEARGRKLVKPGWRALQNGDDTVEDEGYGQPDNPVPELTEGAAICAVSGKVLDKQTRPPPYYTKPSLVEKLESEGVGRPSTFASTVKTILDHGLVIEKVVNKKKFLVQTAQGDLVVDSLVGRCQFIEVGYTKQVESQLDEIAAGKLTYRELVGSVHDQLDSELHGMPVMVSRDATGEAVICGVCGKPMRQLKGKTGPFWGCSGFPECTNTMADVDGKAVQQEEANRLRTLDAKGNPVVCPTCQQPMRRISAKGGMFWGCTGYPSCKTTMDDRKGMAVERGSAPASSHVCGKCGKALVQRKGSKGKFWGCSGYPECRQTYPDKRGKPVFGAAKSSV